MKKYFAEGFLIVFSVLFALFINKIFDDYQTNKKKGIAIESIKKELAENSKVLERWKKKHRAMGNRLTEIIEGKRDSLKNELFKNNYLDLGVMTDGESLVDGFLTNTAWESAKATGIISEFDFAATQKFTRVYSMQDILMDKSIGQILDYYFDKETHVKENVDQILIQFNLKFWELTGQEELMTTLYKDAMDQLD